MATTVTTKGQVTIPKKVREHLDIGPGSSVEFETAPDGRVFIMKKGARRKTATRAPSRFGTIRGTATAGLSTRQIMALTRRED
jgi:AbrB family looped-hinge helix DNA binding protein